MITDAVPKAPWKEAVITRAFAKQFPKIKSQNETASIYDFSVGGITTPYNAIWIQMPTDAEIETRNLMYELFAAHAFMVRVADYEEFQKSVICKIWTKPEHQPFVLRLLNREHDAFMVTRKLMGLATTYTVRAEEKPFVVRLWGSQKPCP